MSKIFCYGLFIDRSLLTAKDLDPEVIGRAVLSGYRIHIGERADPASASGLSQRIEALLFDSACVGESAAFGEVSWFLFRGSAVQSR